MIREAITEERDDSEEIDMFLASVIRLVAKGLGDDDRRHPGMSFAFANQTMIGILQQTYESIRAEVGESGQISNRACASYFKTVAAMACLTAISLDLHFPEGSRPLYLLSPLDPRYGQRVILDDESDVLA